MRILGFDTATQATAVALLDLDGGAITEARDDPEPGRRPGHGAQLLPLIAEVLRRGGCSWDQVGRIAVGIGPGTFTGLRIGVATARALARARGIPLVGVSTLESLALGAVDEARAAEYDALLTVLDARRAEVFAAAWTVPAARGYALGGRLLEPVPLAPERLAEAAARLGRRRLAIGGGAVEFRAILEPSVSAIPGRDSRLHRVSARHHCALARAGQPAQPSDVRPEYLRLADAELSLRAADQR